MTPPAGYSECGTLDLSKNRFAQIGIMVAGIALLLPFGWLVLRFLALTRPAEVSFGGSFDGWGIVITLGVIGGVTVLMALIHEAIHGVFFWLLTLERPIFGFRGLYAYAAAPDCLIGRDRYLVIGLAPLVLMSLIGLALLAVIPAGAIPVVALIVVFNGAGSAGDIALSGWLLTRPRTALVHDQGDACTIYQPA